MKFKHICSVLFILLALSVCASSLRADSLDASLSNPTLTGAAGGTVTFVATLSTPSTNLNLIFLNGDAPSASPLLTVSDVPFNTNFPSSLSHGSSITADIFSVFLDPTIATGLYTGTFSILGGGDSNALVDLANLKFTVDVTPSTSVAEPRSITLLFASGLLALVG